MDRTVDLMKGLIFNILFCFSIPLLSTNPIITHIFTADPAALVYNDTVYLFTGHDEASTTATSFYMRDWHVFSSVDMINWKDHGAVLSLANFTWASANAWAGQCIERNGKFYWFVPMSHASISGYAIGVAVSDKPYGLYTDAIGKALITNNMTTDQTISWDDIDPSVFIDDDGQAYLFWGNTSCKYVKLKENMIELDGDIKTISLTSFTEAPWVHKRNGLYYLSYAYEYPEKIDYVTSSSITGPWTHRGRINRIMENSPTNHQSIIEYKNQAYFIYHSAGLPGGTEYRRSVCIDYLFYNEDGTIREVVQTAEGVQHADSTFICPPVPITPKMQVNNEEMTEFREQLLIEGDDVVLSPETSEDGNWNWAGPDSFSFASREVVLNDLQISQSGTYQVTFTNQCRTKSYMTFSLEVNPELPENIKSGQKYIIKPKNSEFAISVKDASTDDGAYVIQTTLTNATNQQWRLTNVESLYWRVSPMNVVSKGLDVNDFSTADGAKVQTWNYWGGTTQQWQIIEQDSGIYQMKARHSGKCLEMASSTINARARQWTCSTSERQLFTITPYEDIVSIDNINLLNNSNIIYPNPSIDGNIVIDLSTVEDPSEVSISDINGKEYYFITIADEKIIRPDIHLLPGIYIVKIVYNQGIYYCKFINY